MEKALKETSLYNIETAVENLESGGDPESAKQDIERIVSVFVADKKSIGFNDKSFDRLLMISSKLKKLYQNSKEFWQFEISETLLCTLLTEIPRIMKQKGFVEVQSQDAQIEMTLAAENE